MKLFRVLFLLVLTSCSNEPNNSELVNVYLIKNQIAVDITNPKKFNSGDTVTLVKIMDVTLKNMPWYSPEYVLSEWNIKFDTVVYKKGVNRDSIFSFVRAVVRK